MDTWVHIGEPAGAGAHRQLHCANIANDPRHFGNINFEPAMKSAHTFALLVGLSCGVSSCSAGVGSGPGPSSDTPSSQASDSDGGDAEGGSEDSEEDETDTETGGSGGGSGGGDEGDACELSEARIRRLGPEQYDNTVATFIPAAGSASDGWRATFGHSGSISHSTGTLTLAAPHVAQLLAVAQELAGKLSADPALIADCIADQPSDPECQDTFVTKLLDRAVRRPPNSAEREAYLAFLRSQLEAYGSPAAIEQVVARALMSPDFLFRTELGDASEEDGDVLELGAHELASQISYFLRDAPPDETLRAAADSGLILEDVEKKTQIERLLDTKETAEGVRRFLRDHIGSEGVRDAIKDSEVFPQFLDANVAVSMAAETRAFVDHIMWSDDGTLQTLMTAPYTFINKHNAFAYGLDPTGFDENVFSKYDFGTELRAGFLTQPSVLATHSGQIETSIVYRGLYVTEEILCREIPPPPEGVDAVVPQFDDSTPMTQRERLEIHKADPLCATCHGVFDPLGYTFEHYDALGMWRETDHGLPIDASGEVPASGDAAAIPAAGAMDTVQALAGHPEVRRCFAQRMYTYAYGRHQDADRCAVDDLDSALASSGGAVLEAVTELILSDQFARRRPADDDASN